MPVRGLSERRRLPRDLKIALGVRANRNSPPKEVDYFVLSRDIDGKGDTTADPDMVKEAIRVYGPKPKELRMALLAELEAVDPNTGDEMVWNLWNRAYGSNAGLRCKGNGGDANLPGTAETIDKGWAEVIGKASNEKPELLPNNRYRVRCMGTDCPFYAATGEDGKLAPGHENGVCKKVAVLRAMLLYPDKNPDSENYNRPLGSIEIATSSVNAMIDVPSGLALMRSYAGRSAVVPFTLVRQPMYTYKTGKKLHFIVKAKFDLQEVQRIGLIPANQAFLPLEMRETYLRLRSAEVNFDSVRDLYPGVKGLPAHEAEPKERIVHVVQEADGTDREEAVAEAQEEAAEQDAELLRTATEAERDELKDLAGGRVDRGDPTSDWKPEVRDRLVRAVQEYDRVHSTKTEKIAAITKGQAIWITSLLAAENEEPGPNPDEEPIPALPAEGRGDQVIDGRATPVQGELV
jgi:Recombination directionality factor-like